MEAPNVNKMEEPNTSGPEFGSYIYCIIGTSEPKSFGPYGIPDGFPELYTVNHRDIAAVVSRSPVQEYPVTREHTMAHHQVIERLLPEHVVLPVQFSTVAKSDEQIVEKVLKPRYEEFQRLLQWVAGKEAIEVRASWIDVEPVFQELAQESEAIQALKARIANKPVDATYYDRIDLGRLVQEQLKAKQRQTADWMLETLKVHACDWRDNSEKLYGDRHISYLAFLVEQEHTAAFEQAVAELRAASNGRINLKVRRRIAPFDFVTIIIKLDEDTEPGAPSGSQADLSAETRSEGSPCPTTQEGKDDVPAR